MKSIVVIAHDIRSAHNIGALFRLCDGLGIDKIYLTGHSPYPQHKGDNRLPHLAKRATALIHKTALGAEDFLPWEYNEDVASVISELKAKEYKIVSAEQSEKSVSIEDSKPNEKIAVIIGNEVDGVDQSVLRQSDQIIEIPMLGKKESHNVISAAAIILSRIKLF